MPVEHVTNVGGQWALISPRARCAGLGCSLLSSYLELDGQSALIFDAVLTTLRLE